MKTNRDGSSEGNREVQIYSFSKSRADRELGTGSGFYGRKLTKLPDFFIPHLIFRRHLGGKCPDNVDVWNPRLNTKVKIDVPTMDYEALYKIFTRENVVSLCTDVLHSVSEWKNLIERNISEDQSLQLAWRSGTTLDWVWLDDDIEGKARRWAVLCGLATKQVGSLFLKRND